jgi:hypothetical protein
MIFLRRRLVVCFCQLGMQRCSINGKWDLLPEFQHLHQKECWDFGFPPLRQKKGSAQIPNHPSKFSTPIHIGLSNSSPFPFHIFFSPWQASFPPKFP